MPEKPVGQRNKTRCSFSLKFLVLLVLLIAVLLVPISYLYRAYQASPIPVAACVIALPDDSEQQFNPDFYQRIAKHHGATNIAALRRSTSPSEWVEEHLRIKPSADSNVIVVEAIRRRNEKLDQADAKILTETAIEVCAESENIKILRAPDMID